MAKKPNPTPDLLRQLLRYEPETGKLYWRERPSSLFQNLYRSAEGCAANWNSRWAGREALTCRMPNGHLQGRIDYGSFLAHRVAWAIYYGEWPEDHIDHINHDPADNRIENLRVVTHAENHRNLSRRADNSSGVTGVQRVGNVWVASIKHGGKRIYLGRFSQLDEAAAVRKAAERRFGYHPNHGV